MADAREQGPTGNPPIDPGHGVGDVRTVKVDMGQGPPAVRREPERHTGGGGGASVLLSSALALIFGGAGAWAYERFAPRPVADAAHPGPASPSAGHDAEPRKEAAGLEDRVNKLSDRCNELADEYKQLQARVESMPRSASAPDLGPIEQKVARVDELSRQVEDLGKKLTPMRQQLEQSERRIADLGEQIGMLRVQDSTARVRPARGRDRQVEQVQANPPFPQPGATANPDPDAIADARQPAPEREPGPEPRSAATADRTDPDDGSLGSAEALFREKHYGEAYAAFRRLLQSQPDDARPWYYAALAYGLATGDWDRVTQSMAEEGASREKAGKPAKAEIDAAFAGLTRETGKEWLDFYRHRAH